MIKSYLFGVLAVAAVAIVACTGQAEQEPQGLVIEKQGVFSSGGRVTEAIPGEYDPTQNWLDPERKGTTTHVDHANTFMIMGTGFQTITTDSIMVHFPIHEEPIALVSMDG